MREIKFRAWRPSNKFMSPRLTILELIYLGIYHGKFENSDEVLWMQYTGLKDKNGSGLTEVYEGDIIAIDGTLKGNIHENHKEPTDIVIPQLGTKAWESAYKEAVDRGYNYSE